MGKVVVGRLNTSQDLLRVKMVLQAFPRMLDAGFSVRASCLGPPGLCPFTLSFFGEGSPKIDKTERTSGTNLF